MGRAEAARESVRAIASAAAASDQTRLQWLTNLVVADPDSGASRGEVAVFASRVERGTNLVMVRSTQPIDRGFLKAMVFHRRAAIRMANAVLELGQAPVLSDWSRQLIIDLEGEIGRLRVELGGSGP